METKQPTRPKEHTPEEELAVVMERLKTLDSTRKTARPADEVFRRILEKPKP